MFLGIPQHCIKIGDELVEDLNVEAAIMNCRSVPVPRSTEIPEALGQTHVSLDLIRHLVRHRSAEYFVTAKDLGSPPPKAAKSNRMTAGGISAFYGATTHAGALAEVTGYTADDYATVGTWAAARPMLVIDLVDLPTVPSLFDPDQRHRRSDLLFLHGFAADVRRPAKPDDKEHLDYVPTQIVAEYFRHLIQDDDRNPAMGVLWRSAMDPTVTNCVLFVDNMGCVDQTEEWTGQATSWLGLVPGSLQRGALTDTSAWVKEDPTTAGPQLRGG